jgi:tight adherence protein B
VDALSLATGLAVAGAVFVAVLALESSLTSTRQVVQSRILSTGSAEPQHHGVQLNVPRLVSLSERGRRTALDLERAGLAFTVTEYLIIRSAVAVGFAILGVLLGSELGFGLAGVAACAVIGYLLGYMLPNSYLTQRKERRLRRIEDQLLELLVSMSKSLRAGVGLTQALEYAGREAAAPLGPEILRVVRNLQLGADVENVFDDLNQRIGSNDLEIATAAIIIQRRVGGNLSEILSNVANTIRERRAIRSELHALTSKQRLQGNASALIPVLVAVFFFLVNPDTAKLLFTTTTGNIALAIGIFFELLGLWMVRRFAVIEV